jgi:hypothetical protein
VSAVSAVMAVMAATFQSLGVNKNDSQIIM